MKILIAGSSWHHGVYEASWKNCFENLGIKVVPFSLLYSPASLVSRIERKYSLRGLTNKRINANLISTVAKENPDLVMIWIGTNIFKETIEAIKNKRRIVVSYIHDDPFAHLIKKNKSPQFYKKYYQQFISAIPSYDHLFFSKRINVEECKKLGAQDASVLMQYFVPTLHFPVPAQDIPLVYKCDIAFAGHFESDGRDKAIEALASMGYSVHVYGDFSWKKSQLTGSNNLKLFPRANGSAYQLAIAGAKICLCFMSKLNRDEYTTRCFEIPAIGSLLLAERTDSLSNIFVEDVEAVFFSSINELREKINFLMDNPEVINKISKAGMSKVMMSGHAVENRANEVLRTYQKIIKKRR